MKVAKEWHGLVLQERINRAAGRAIVAIGQEVANETKRVTHVGTGQLRRSVHVAPPNAPHDESEGATGDMMMMSSHVEPEHGAEGPMVEVGSWLDYACVEWVGRGHPGVTQGLEAVRGMRTTAIVMQAFAEEGLGRFGRGGRSGGGGVGGNGNFAPGGGGVVGELRRIAEREARGSGA